MTSFECQKMRWRGNFEEFKLTEKIELNHKNFKLTLHSLLSRSNFKIDEQVKT